MEVASVRRNECTRSLSLVAHKLRHVIFNWVWKETINSLKSDLDHSSRKVVDK